MTGIALPGAVVVITGASSGIGRAAAIAFAKQGANLVLSARRAELLREVAQECSQAARSRRYRRSKAIAVTADTGDTEDMRNLVQVALKRFGRIDVWVNNAGVGAVGAFTDVPIDAHDQVVRTNLLGYMHGAHAVVPVFIRQNQGILINNISFAGWVPAPFAASFSASKFGLRGFADALRAELQISPNIHVCDVFPSVIDTPAIQHSANYTGRFLKPAPPVLAAEKVADAMVSLARSPRNAVTVGAMASVARLGYAILPGLSRWIMRRMAETYLERAPRIATGPGNLFTPVPQGRGKSGYWRHSTRTRCVAATGMGIAAAMGLTAWFGWNKSGA